MTPKEALAGLHTIARRRVGCYLLADNDGQCGYGRVVDYSDRQISPLVSAQSILAWGYWEACDIGLSRRELADFTVLNAPKSLKSKRASEGRGRRIVEIVPAQLHATMQMENEATKCPRCWGVGKIECYPHYIAGIHHLGMHVETCPDCKGTGMGDSSGPANGAKPKRSKLVRVNLPRTPEERATAEAKASLARAMAGVAGQEALDTVEVLVDAEAGAAEVASEERRAQHAAKATGAAYDAAESAESIMTPEEALDGLHTIAQRGAFNTFLLADKDGQYGYGRMVSYRRKVIYPLMFVQSMLAWGYWHDCDLELSRRETADFTVRNAQNL